MIQLYNLSKNKIMKPKIKSFIILFITLLIGIAIGFELNGILNRHRFESEQKARSPQGFINFFEDLIKPDTNQKKEIETIILKYHSRLDNIRQDNMQKVSVIIDSMNIELKSKLNKEQSARLDAKLQEMRKFPPPPPNGGPAPDPRWKRGPAPMPEGDRRPIPF